MGVAENQSRVGNKNRKMKKLRLNKKVVASLSKKHSENVKGGGQNTESQNDYCFSVNIACLTKAPCFTNDCVESVDYCYETAIACETKDNCIISKRGYRCVQSDFICPD